MATFPPELVEIIVQEIWHSEMPSVVRRSFMKTCPQINRTWKAVYAPIASRDIYIPSLAYIYYLCGIAGRQKSVIYYDLIPRLTRAITCFVDCRENAGESVVKQVYALLMWLPNDAGLRALFPQVPCISFETSWIGGAQVMADFQVTHGPLIHIRYDRFLSQPREDRCTRMDAHVSVTDLNPSRGGCWKSVLFELHDAGLCLPRLRLLSQRSVCSGVLYSHQTTYVSEFQGDLKAINWSLWMASKRPHGLRLLAYPRHCWEYRQSQSCLPVCIFGAQFFYTLQASQASLFMF
ncbi:uncharacterized protein ARMOST_03861 [Armillaria ostoyae]|uniref:Uncharacterized protein n=1 Tax=Armillaria ostoyae TaxID=47428 RepID=A0A284QVN8_ARMOS|nr:uncharacterized protein ARMOST_03861 [Armillaria ostoyae]